MGAGPPKGDVVRASVNAAESASKPCQKSCLLTLLTASLIWSLWWTKANSTWRRLTSWCCFTSRRLNTTRQPTPTSTRTTKLASKICSCARKYSRWCSRPVEIPKRTPENKNKINDKKRRQKLIRKLKLSWRKNRWMLTSSGAKKER